MKHVSYAIIPYLLFAIFWFISLNEIGIVGEIYGGVAQHPPIVLQKTIPEITLSCHSNSIITFCETRPLLSIYSFPILINLYTGGIFDWPTRIVYHLSHSFLSVQILYGFCGFFIIWLTRFIYEDCISKISIFASFFLVLHPCFLLYKKILGGTEIALQIALLLMIWGMIQVKRESWLFLGVFCAFFAKWVSIIPISVCIAFLLYQRRIKSIFIIIVICLSLCLFMYWIHTQTPNIIRSHDDFQLQWNRLIDNFFDSQRRPDRENWGNVLYFLSSPMMFFSKAYQAQTPLGHIFSCILTGFGWIFLFVSWFRNKPSICFLFAIISISLLTLIAKDMHHLAMLLPILSLGIAEILQKYKIQTQLMVFGIFFLGYVPNILQGDHQLKSITTPTFGWSKQKKIIETLQKHNVQTVITMDYEIYGVVEMLDPDIKIIHTWGAISHEGYQALPQILHMAKGSHLLVCESSMPMIYNLHPPKALLLSKARELSLHIQLIDSWEGIALYKIQ